MERILSFGTAKTLWIIQLTETRLQFIIQETILWRMRAAFSDLSALALTKIMEACVQAISWTRMIPWVALEIKRLQS